MNLRAYEPKISVTDQQVEDAIVAAVEERGPDYVYPGTGPGDGTSCHYRWDSWDVDKGYAKPEDLGKPACGVGLVFSKWVDDLDYIFERMVTEDPDYHQYSENGSGATDLIWSLRNDATLHISNRGLKALALFQELQDAGTPWGEAAFYAIERLHDPNPDLDED